MRMTDISPQFLVTLTMPKNLSGIDYPSKPPAAATNTSLSVLDLFSMKGKVAAISGASSGIGYNIAEAFAQAGADVAVWYNTHDPRERIKPISEKYGVRIKAYKVNVTDSEAVEDAVNQIVLDFGKLDAFVANAGVIWTKGCLLDEPDHAEWNKVLSTNLTGSYYCAKAVGSVFRKQGHGSLIFTTSISASIVNVPHHLAAYCTSKAGIVHLAKSLAVEWAGFARVNCVSPGFVDTEMTADIPQEVKDAVSNQTPIGRACVARELVGAYVYLASDASTYTTGCDLLVDGGYTCI